MRGNLHVRFDEGRGTFASPLLYCPIKNFVLFLSLQPSFTGTYPQP